MAVEVQRDVRPEPFARATDEVGGRLGRGDADRVDDDRLGGAGLARGLVRRLEEFEVRPGAVDAEERDEHAVPSGVTDRVADSRERLVAIEPVARRACRLTAAIRSRPP